MSRATWDFHLAWFWAQVAITAVLEATCPEPVMGWHLADGTPYPDTRALSWFWAQITIAGLLDRTAWLEADREETHATIRAILAMRDPPARRYVS